MKTKICVCLLVISIFSGIISLYSCQPVYEKYTEYSLDYFDTVTTVIGYEKSESDFDAVCADIIGSLESYHKLFDIYTRYDGLNNLCSLNQKEGGEHPELKVDEKIIDLLLYAKEIYALTEGETNIAMGSVLSIWHDYRGRGEDDVLSAELPPMSMLIEAAEHTDINSIVINEEKSTVKITDPKTLIDVGAIAKGYAVEMIARELEARGISGYLLNVGGNVRAVGKKPDGALWRIGVNDPTSEENGANLEVLAFENQALVSSGSYQRFYVVNGKSYHHIIDRETLMPAEGFLQVSIVCGDSGLADGLSTALFCMPLDAGLALVESLEGVEALFVSESGEITRSSGFDSIRVDK